MTAIKVRQIEEKLNGIRTLTKAIAEKQDSNSAALAAAGLVLKEAANERAEVLRALNALTVQIPDEEPSALDSLRDSIARETEQLEILDAERKALTERYRVLVNAAQLQMDDLKEEIRSSMTHYSEAFIQEAVRISFKRQTPFKLATGAGQVNIPTFSVAMTSSTHHIAKERLSSENVSESQKEFLDLAFRMTLLDLINPGQPTMMVVETPEASLDTWFMRRAADLMREFAPEDSHSRKMLATSNLNGTKMIPALLGILSDDDKTTRLPPSRSSHLVDLMALSATATVLKEPKARRTLEEELGRYKNG